MLKNYVVGITDIFNGVCTLYKISAENPSDARLQAIKLEGWELAGSLQETLDQIDSIVSDALEI